VLLFKGATTLKTVYSFSIQYHTLIELSYHQRLQVTISFQADLLDCSTTSDTPKSPLPGSSSRELLDVFGKQDNRRCVSVNDIRRAFEKAEQSLSETVKGNGQGGEPIEVFRGCM